MNAVATAMTAPHANGNAQKCQAYRRRSRIGLPPLHVLAAGVAAGTDVEGQESEAVAAQNGILALVPGF
jgi:hypothetical protein